LVRQNRKQIFILRKSKRYRPPVIESEASQKAGSNADLPYAAREKAVIEPTRVHKGPSIRRAKLVLVVAE
jgi:hypothetical protein